jgi:undecaprenyl diphosphate synthase
MHPNFVGIIKAESDDAKLLSQIDLSRLPQHIAVIMDGNGRWAKLRGKPRIFGHREGAESVRAILDTCARLEVKAVTLYAFSTENWKRPKAEVSALMSMLKKVLRKELDEVHGNNIRFRTIGDTVQLSPDVQRQLQIAVEKTRENTGTILNVALNYGSRAEIVRAARLAFSDLERRKEGIDHLTEADIERNLYTAGLPASQIFCCGRSRTARFM